MDQSRHKFALVSWAVVAYVVVLSDDYISCQSNTFISKLWLCAKKTIYTNGQKLQQFMVISDITNFSAKIAFSNWPFSNMPSDWLAAVLPANQKPNWKWLTDSRWKIQVNQIIGDDD